MDIDLFWSIGGFCRFFPHPHICMATKPNSSSSSSSDQISAKSLHFFLFFSLLFVLLAFVNSSGEFSKPPEQGMAAAALPSRKTLFSKAYGEKDDPTVDFHPGKRADRDPKSKRKDQFEAGEHEVPSGPNPISNK